MKIPSARYLLLLQLICHCYSLHAADRYWVHKTVYQNYFSTAPELSDWQLIEDNGTGGFALSGNGTSVLTMDNAAGGFANRLFNLNGGSPRLLPFDLMNGRAELLVKSITGGNQRIFLQAQEFDGSASYLGQVDILPAQSATGFFSVDLSTISWDPSTVQVRFIIGGENYSAQQGTAEFSYFSYSNTNNNWSNSANWSTSSGGAGGASVPGPADNAIFDGAGGSNGSCLLDVTATISSMQVTGGYSGNIDLQNNHLTIGAGGVSLAGGGITGDIQDIQINGNISITGGAFKNSTGNLYVLGNVAITGGILDFALGTVIFDGSTDQQFSSSVITPVTNLVVDKPSGAINFSSDILVSGTLTLTQGLLNTGSHTVRLGTDALNTGVLVTGSGLINGNFARWIAPSSSGSISFPFGNSVATAPLILTIATPPSTGGIVSGFYTDAAPGYTSVNFQDNGTTIRQRFNPSWTMQTNTVNDGAYSLSLSDDHLQSISMLSDLHLTLAGGIAGTHQAATGTLTVPVVNRASLAATDLAQTFYISSVANVLPVIWVDFEVLQQENSFVWNWKVAEEDHIAYYEPEYSTDGTNFVAAGIVGTPTSTHDYTFRSALSLFGNIFFRVREVDLDGKSVYSITKQMNVNDIGIFSVYPNPATGVLHIHWPDAGATSVTTVIYDTKGAVVLQQTEPYRPVFDLPLSRLAPGSYLLYCQDNNLHRSPVCSILKTRR